MEQQKNQPLSQQKTESPAPVKTGDTTTTKSEYTVDEVIEDHVGSLGYSQLIQVILVSLAWIFDAQSTLVSIFSDAEPEWRCKESYKGSFHGVCLGGQIHKGTAVCGLEPGSWEWVGGHRSSIIAEWGLVCHHKFLAAIPASCMFIGSLIGSVIYGRLADSVLGRKKALFLSCLLSAITGFLTAFSPNIWAYAAFRFTNGLARSGIGSCCLVLATEVVGRKWRGQVGQYGFFFFTAGFLALPLMGYFTRTSWRSLYWVTSSLPFAYSIFIIPFVAESPRWLLIRGRKNEALTILANFAKRNGRELPANLKLVDPTLSNPGEGSNKSNMKLWECKWAILRMCIAMVAGFGVGFMYYGIQLNVENMNFSKYLTVAVNALMEIPAVLIGGLLLSTTKRRVLFSVSSFIAGVSCLLCMFFTKGKGHTTWGSWIQLGIESVGFMAASNAYDVLYVYCVELFPTNVRNFAVSLLRQALMLGASVAPLLVVVGRLRPALSFLVFGGLAIVSGVVSLWLPETRNVPLYETLEQQEKEEKLSHRGCCDHSGLEMGQGDQKPEGL